AACAFWGLGVAFPAIRPTFHEPRYQTLVVFWIVWWSFAVALARFKRDVRYGALVLLLPVFAFFPTVYRYVSVAAMAPAWLGFLMCTLAPVRDEPEHANAPLAPALISVAAPALFLLPFLAVDSSDYRFDEWRLYMSDSSPVVWIVGAAV